LSSLISSSRTSPFEDLGEDLGANPK
jgi:hypothetical protein